MNRNRITAAAARFDLACAKLIARAITTFGLGAAAGISWVYSRGLSCALLAGSIFVGMAAPERKE